MTLIAGIAAGAVIATIGRFYIDWFRGRKIKNG